MRAKRTRFLQDEDCKSPSLIKNELLRVQNSQEGRGEFQLSAVIPSCLCLSVGSTNGISVNVYNRPFLLLHVLLFVMPSFSDTLWTGGSHCSHGGLVNYFIMQLYKSVKFLVSSNT